MIRIIVSFTLLYPAMAFTQDSSEPNSDLSGLPLQELCELRATPETWSEIENRDVFSNRELRAIERERALPGISAAALFCFMGEPDRVISAPVRRDVDPYDVYAFQVDDDEWLVASVRHRLKRETSQIVVAYTADTATIQEMFSGR